MHQHNIGQGAKYTSHRLPVKLVFSQRYSNIGDAFRAEKQVQGWSRKKRQALILGNYDALPELSKKKFAMRVEYFSIIHKYIPPDSLVYPIYMTHCHMVTRKALAIGRRLDLNKASLRFIEEAAMLHDIGIIKTDTPVLHCYGNLPYLCHGPEGRAILDAEGLPDHALVAERHIGVGLTVEDIVAQELPLPHRDMTCQSVEEEIISYADLFYSKNVKRLWQAKSIGKVRKNTAKHGDRQLQLLERWIQRFEPSV